MSYAVASLLRVGDVAWVRYKKDEDEPGYRIDGPERVTQEFNGSYVGFETTDFTFDDPDGSVEQATDTVKGTMTLWHARAAKPKRRSSR